MLSRILYASLLLLLLLLAPPLFADDMAPRDLRLARVQALIDQGLAQQALGELEALWNRDKPGGEALLLRSTARIMTGDAKGGFKDLERAVKIDPTLRQGWLNLAGLEIAEGRYEQAIKALEKARELDPSASDSFLNLGAVAVLQGQTETAQMHFEKYLDVERDTAEAHYMIATNWAVGGYEEATVRHLRRAIESDERSRMRARADGRFATLVSAEYRELLNSDIYRLPEGAFTTAAAFREPYNRRDPRLLYAVIDALKQLGEPYDPNVEATETWALIWAEMRIKLFNQTNGTGVVSVSATKDSMTADEWHRRTQELFRKIHEVLELQDERALEALRNRRR